MSNYISFMLLAESTYYTTHVLPVTVAKGSNGGHLSLDSVSLVIPQTLFTTCPPGNHAFVFDTRNKPQIPQQMLQRSLRLARQLTLKSRTYDDLTNHSQFPLSVYVHAVEHTAGIAILSALGTQNIIGAYAQTFSAEGADMAGFYFHPDLAPLPIQRSFVAGALLMMTTPGHIDIKK
jgi:hypothetical protein